MPGDKMSEGIYHFAISSALKELAKSKGYNEGNLKYSKLFISHPTMNKLSFEYVPDFWINSTKPGGLFIFEVLDDQMTDPDKIIADLLQSYLVHILTNIRKKIIFIVPTKSAAEKVTVYCSIVRDCLIKKGIKKNELPDPLVYTILESETKNKEKLIEILDNFSKKDGWHSLGKK